MGGGAGRRTTAGDVVAAHVAEQVRRIAEADGPVRRDEPGSVHAMRVATRRLRSALATFRPLLDRAVTEPVGDELRWWAGVLGEARDAEVLRDRLADPAVGDAVAVPLAQAYRDAHAAVLVGLDGDRYRALRAALDTLVEHPPLTALADRRARSVLPPLVARSGRRVRRAMKAARRAADPAAREEGLHDARKAAKRARYAAEAVSGVVGRDARRYAAAMADLQEALGEHLETRSAQARLHALADATADPAAAFAIGRLHALEGVRGEAAVGGVERAWAAARRKRLRRWTR